MREIKFRGKDEKGDWHYGNLLADSCVDGTDAAFISPGFPVVLTAMIYRVDPATVGQFTGLHDKAGREIYEGDIIKFYDLDTYCINPDCEPHLLGYGSRLVEREEVVVFDDGVFGIDDEFHPIRNLMSCGFRDFDLEDLENYKNDPYFDTNGYDLDDVIGSEVIGNVFDNSDLIKKGGEE